MSLYLVCGLLHAPGERAELLTFVRGVAETHSLVAKETNIDPGEMAVLTRADASLANSLLVQICDYDNSMEATASWNDAVAIARHYLDGAIGPDHPHPFLNSFNDFALASSYFISASQSSLGKLLSAIFAFDKVHGGFIAPIESQIEKAILLSQEQCRQQLFKLLLVSWDDLGETAYCWHK